MLTNASVAPTIPVTDIARARRFYQQVLGLNVIQEDPSPGIMFQCGRGTMLYIYQRSASKCDHTLASFMVDDIDAQASDLRSKGITFEEYNIPSMGIKTINGIATSLDMKSAWFKDLDGNLLSIVQMVKMPAASTSGTSTESRYK